MERVNDHIKSLSKILYVRVACKPTGLIVQSACLVFREVIT